MSKVQTPAPRAAAPGPQHLRELTCVVVEDQGMFQELLCGMLKLCGGLLVLAGAATVAEGRKMCRQHRPDVLMLDLDLPDGNGLEVARALIACRPEARVMVVSGHAEDFVCPDWLYGNLQAVLGKNETFQALRAELEELLGSRGSSGPPRGRAVFEKKPLSSREAEIFRHMGDGFSNKEIAGLLHLSEHTVRAHRKRIAAKLGTVGGELLYRAVAQREAFFSSQGG